MLGAVPTGIVADKYTFDAQLIKAEAKPYRRAIYNFFHGYILQDIHTCFQGVGIQVGSAGYGNPDQIVFRERFFDYYTSETVILTSCQY
jgi:hypothetical protein